MYKRLLPLQQLLSQKSFFLFGPRSTGKTTLVNECFPESPLYDLLNPELFSRLLRKPQSDCPRIPLRGAYCH